MSFTNILFTNPAEARQTCTAIIGGGGKTSLLFALGHEFARHFGRVLLTSLTRASSLSSLPITPLHQVPGNDLEPLFARQNPLYILNKFIEDNKATGINAATLLTLSQRSELTLFECDGAGQRSLKVHRNPDPPVPDFASQVIIVIGADVVDKRVTAKTVHRQELFRSTWALDESAILTPEFIARVVTLKKGYQSIVPEKIKTAYFVNQADVHPDQARRLAKAIGDATADPVWIGSVYAETLERIS